MPFLTQGKTNWKYILILLILAVLVGGGILVWVEKQEVPSIELFEIKKPEKIVKEEPRPENETANWKTYRNEEYGFEIKYPEDWDWTIIKEVPNYPIMFGPEDIIAKVRESLQNIENDKDLTLWITVYDKMLFERGILPYREKSTGYIKVTSSEINVGGAKGMHYTTEFLEDKGNYKKGEKTITVDLPLDGNYLSLHLFDYQYSDIFEKILSTLKNPNWKTYENKELKIVFEYPKEWGQLTFESKVENDIYSFKSSNEDIKLVLYHKPTKMIVFVAKGKEYELVYGGKSAQEILKIIYPDKRTKTLYTVPPESVKWYGKIGNVQISPNGKYISFIYSAYEFSEPKMFNIETHQNILKGLPVWFEEPKRNIFWSPNNEVLAIRSEMNQFGGEGICGLFVSEYGNPDKLNKVWEVPPKECGFQGINVKEVRFISDEMLSFEIGKERHIYNPKTKEIEKWTTYRNEKYGFEFGYPVDWEIKESVPASCQTCIFPYSFSENSSPIKVTIYKEFKKSYILEKYPDYDEEWAEISYCSLSIITTLKPDKEFNKFKEEYKKHCEGLIEVKVGGIKTLRCSPAIGPAHAHGMWLEKNKKGVAIITGFLAPGDECKFDQILSTFRFLTDSPEIENKPKKLSPEEISERLSECKNIKDSFERKVCFGNLAIDANDPTLCPKSDSSLCKYFVFMWHTDLCSDIPIEKPVFFGAESNQASLQKLKKKQECIKKIAIDTKNIELCQNLFDQATDCQNRIAIKLNDPSKCSDYPEDYCVMKIALNRKDISICESKYDKAWCITMFPRLLQESRYREDQKCYEKPLNLAYDYKGEIAKYDYAYPNVYDDGANDYPEDLAPESVFGHILSIPFNKSNAILRVYMCKSNNGSIRLIKYFPSDGSSKFVGDIRSKHGSNWGGIYIPFGISKDDSHLLFEAQMDYPAAGGGSIDLGYAFLSLTSPEYDECGYLNPEKIGRSIFSGKVYFYDNFSKALFYSEEKNVPPSIKPGHDYNSAIKFINIITGETKTLVEEPKTIYEIINIDERLGVVNFKSCPWQECIFSCPTSDSSTQIRSLKLP